MDPRYGQVLRSLKASKKEQLPPFAQNILPIIKQDVDRLQKQIKTINQKERKNKSQSQSQLQSQQQTQQNPDQSMFGTVKKALLISQIYRIKRFLLVYHNFRCNKLQDQFWSMGGNLKPQIKKNLSQQELEYFNQYKNIATQYMQQVGLQLTEDLDPPIDSQVEVRFLQDCGQILTDDGQKLKLQKNALLYLKKRLIQNLIKQGKAVIITH